MYSSKPSCVTIWGSWHRRAFHMAQRYPEEHSVAHRLLFQSSRNILEIACYASKNHSQFSCFSTL